VKLDLDKSDFFREIYVYARERFDSDRATYHTSSSLERAPLPQDIPDADLIELLDQFDARQILHISLPDKPSRKLDFRPESSYNSSNLASK
jgi:hypothetical protein